jgi:hypothetical protein
LVRCVEGGVCQALFPRGRSSVFDLSSVFRLKDTALILSRVVEEVRDGGAKVEKGVSAWYVRVKPFTARKFSLES